METPSITYRCDTCSYYELVKDPGSDYLFRTPSCVVKSCKGVEMRPAMLHGGTWLAKTRNQPGLIPPGVTVLIMSEIANMQGHYVVIEQNGKMHFGLHLENFDILFGDDL